MRDRDTGRSRGFGFVTYASQDEANAAIGGLNEQELDGRRVKVNMANARGTGSTAGAGGGGFGGAPSGGFSGGYGGEFRSGWRFLLFLLRTRRWLYWRRPGLSSIRWRLRWPRSLP